MKGASVSSQTVRCTLAAKIVRFATINWRFDTMTFLFAKQFVVDFCHFLHESCPFIIIEVDAVLVFFFLVVRNLYKTDISLVFEGNHFHTPGFG